MRALGWAKDMIERLPALDKPLIEVLIACLPIELWVSLQRLTLSGLPVGFSMECMKRSTPPLYLVDTVYKVL